MPTAISPRSHPQPAATHLVHTQEDVSVATSYPVPHSALTADVHGRSEPCARRTQAALSLACAVCALHVRPSVCPAPFLPCSLPSLPLSTARVLQLSLPVRPPIRLPVRLPSRSIVDRCTRISSQSTSIALPTSPWPCHSALPGESSYYPLRSTLCTPLDSRCLHSDRLRRSPCTHN